MFPIEFPKLRKLYVDHSSNIWFPDHVDLTDDAKDFDKLSANDWKFVKLVLAFFNEADGIVNENLAVRFYADTDIVEARQFYGYQIFNEGVHSETYSKMIQEYVKDDKERKQLFNAIENLPIIAKKAKWALDWMSSKESHAKRLMAFSVIEGVFFSGSFCAIFWLRKRGLLPGLAKANDYISRDEGAHCEFAVELFKTYKYKISTEEAHKMFKEAVDIEKEFVTDSIPVDLIGMNSRLMGQYIEFVADRLLTQFGYPKLWNSTNPFPFMEAQGMENKSNQFERVVTEYAKALDTKISFDDEF